MGRRSEETLGSARPAEVGNVSASQVGRGKAAEKPEVFNPLPTNDAYMRHELTLTLTITLTHKLIRIDMGG